MKNSVTYFFIAFLFLVTSCSKDDNNENLSGNASTVKTTIIGRVFDESGAGLSGADVYIGNKTASTNLWGIYVIEDAIVAKSRSIITVKKAGYWDQVGTFKPKAGGTSSSNLCLYSSMNTHTVNAVLGGTITTIDGASIQFPVDAFEKMDGTTYTGTVALTVHHLSRSANLFSLKAPGTDFKGKSLSNTIENLVSFGMIGATLKDGSGNELKLKNGKKATISLPVHAAQQAIAAPSIPLWHFNEVTALWEEEGTALYNGSMYTAEVSHFSWWNCDVPGGVLAHGYVFDCNNAPYANASIENDDSPDVISDINGYWSGLIEPNSIQKLQAISYSTTSTDSSLPFYTPSLPDFSNLTVPDFHLLNTNCVVISGNVNNCAGQATPATILVINNNQLMNYYYSTNGIFNFGFPSLPPSTIQIIVYKDAYSTAATFNYNGTGNIVAGTLSLCDTTNYTNDAVLIFTNTQIGKFLSH